MAEQVGREKKHKTGKGSDLTNQLIMSTDHRRLTPNGRFLNGRKLSEYEKYAKEQVLMVAHNYQAEVSLGHVLDEDGIIVEENYLVKQKQDPHLQYLMHVIELKDEFTVFNTLREITLLKQIATSNKYLLTYYTHFRHRQYVCILHPPFIPFRNYLDSQMRFKEAGGVTKNGRVHQHNLNDKETSNHHQIREAEILQRIGLFTRNTVAYILRKVIKGVNYIHSKGFAHTELCAHNVFLDSVSNVKLGGFLHLKKLKSTNWNLTSDPNCRPLEAFDDYAVQKVETSVDYWGLGMLTLELITGQRRYLREDKAKRLALEYLSGVRPLPTLGSIQKGSVVRGVQTYDDNVDDFVAHLLDKEPTKRLNFEKTMQHPFIRNPIDHMEVYRELKIAVAVFTPKHTDNRNLYDEMRLSQGSRHDFNEDLLTNAIQAIQHVENQDYFIFKKPSDQTLLDQYIGIEASAAIPYDDADWSREVLNQSNQSINEFSQKNEEFKDTFTRPIDVTNRCNWDYWDFLDGKEKYYDERGISLSTLPPQEQQVKNLHPAVNKNYNRHEIVFFVKKAWGKTERQVFIGMQFARWYKAGVIQFTDFIRLIDEVDEVINDYSITKTRVSSDNSTPDSVYFASPRRDFQLTDYNFYVDTKSTYLAHVYVDVALGPIINKKKLEKFNMLLEDDPTEFPNNMTPLQVSVRFQDVDPKKFELLEAQMLGQIKVANWDVDNQSSPNSTGSKYLHNVIWERRRILKPALHKNERNQIDENVLYHDANNEKFWGDFARDYLHKCTMWGTSYTQKKDLTNILYGTPFQTEAETRAAVKQALQPGDTNLSNQLARTKTKQEGDEYERYKKIEDLSLRRQAADRYKQNSMGKPDYHRLVNQIARSEAGQQKQIRFDATPKKVNRKWTTHNH